MLAKLSQRYRYCPATSSPSLLEESVPSQITQEGRREKGDGFRLLALLFFICHLLPWLLLKSVFQERGREGEMLGVSSFFSPLCPPPPLQPQVECVCFKCRFQGREWVRYKICEVFSFTNAQKIILFHTFIPNCSLLLSFSVDLYVTRR